MGNKIGLLDWMPMIISGLAFILSLISFIYGRKDKKDEKYYKESMQKFEEEKENIRQLERKSDIMENRLNLVSTLMPYFDLRLKNINITTITIKGKPNIKMFIELCNVGKDTGVNIMIYPYKEGNKNYFKKTNGLENDLLIYDYLDENSAKVDDLIKFSAIREIPASGKVVDFVNFKVRYNDLIGNVYEQEFEFGYDNYLVKGFNMKKRSYQPKIIKYADHKVDNN